MEILSIVIGLLGVFFTVVKWSKYKLYTVSTAYLRVEQFRDRWDAARLRNANVDLDELIRNGETSLKEAYEELKNSRVLLSRSSTREMRSLGALCQAKYKRIQRKQVNPIDWPSISGEIGRQLGKTLTTLKN